MATTLTCDRCHKLIESPSDRVRVDVLLPMGVKFARRYDKGIIHLDLHLNCYDEALAPAVDTIEL